MSPSIGRLLSVEGFESRPFRHLGNGEQRERGYDGGVLRDQIAAPFDAVIDPHASTSGRFDFPNGSNEELRHSDAIQHFAHEFFSLSRGTLCNAAVIQRNTISTCNALFSFDENHSVFSRGLFQ